MDAVLAQQKSSFLHPPNYRGWWRKFFLPGIHPCVLPRTSWWKQNVPVGVGRCNFLLALPVTSSFQEERVCFSSRFPGSTLIAQDPSPKQSSQRPLGYMHTELDYTTLNKPADISVTYCPLGILVSVRQSSGLWVVRKKRSFWKLTNWVWIQALLLSAVWPLFAMTLLFPGVT